jgi:ABC-type uncharacterized transport system substrate-binding protein
MLLAAGVLAAPFAGNAQQPGKIHRIGYLSNGIGIQPPEVAFRQRLSELGYVEGKNTVIEWRFNQGKLDRNPELAAELVRLKVDCIVTVGVTPTRAAKQATSAIPILMATIDADPVELGLVANLARPGGNITGFTGIAYDLAGKRLELLKELVPKATRVAILMDPAGRDAAQAHMKGTELAAHKLKMQLQLLEARVPEDLDNAFHAARQERVEALSVVAIGWINSHRRRIVDLAVKTRLPAIYSAEHFVYDGGLMSYSADQIDQYRRTAAYVGKILGGAKPADLPVQQPTKFELVINLPAARQIGLKIPPSMLARADRVIE